VTRRFAGTPRRVRPGLHVVWCPSTAPGAGGRVAGRLRELIEQKATEKGGEIIVLR